MSDLKDFAEKASAVASDAAKMATDLARRAASKTKQMSRITRLNMDISSQKNTIKNAYTEIGKLYYEAHHDDPDGFFIQLFQEIDVANEAIQAMEDEIAYLKKTAEEEKQARTQQKGPFEPEDADFETVVDSTAAVDPDIEVEITVEDEDAPEEGPAPQAEDPAPAQPEEPAPQDVPEGEEPPAQE